MKIFWRSLMLLTLACNALTVGAQNMQVNVNYLLFDYEGDTAYVELQFLFQGEGLTYKEVVAGEYRTGVQLDISFLNPPNNPVVEQFVFYGGAYPDTIASGQRSFYDLVRIPLPYGKYTMKLKLTDIHSPENKPLTYEQKIEVNFPKDAVSTSDIQRIAIATPSQEITKHVKNGYDYLPYFSDFYPENINTMTFMFEIYRTRQILKDPTFKLKTFIAKAGVGQAYGEDYVSFKTLPVDDVYPHFQSFIIDSLPSGNYELVVEVRDMNDSLFANAYSAFQRSNPSVTEPILTGRKESISLDSLLRLLDYIYAIADPAEETFINRAKTKQYDEITAFFAAFWQKRATKDPAGAWANYYMMVQRVNKNYSTLSQKGYKTDRGRCYLKYGAPNSIEYHQGKGRGELSAMSDMDYGIDNSTNYDLGKGVYSHPYEIWWYNEFPTTRQTAVYFVFVDADMVSKDFKLMHSNAFNERKDYLWKAVLEDDGISTPNEYTPNTKQ